MHDEACPEIGPICRQRAEAPQQHHTTLSIAELRVLAEYGLARGLALQATLPFRLLDTRTIYTNLSGRQLELDYPNIHHRNETLAGLGDAQLWLHHGVKLGSWALSERVGVSVPFGRVQPNPYVLGDEGLSHEHIQFGTGTLDPLVGMDASRAFGKVSVAGFVQAQLPLFADRLGYQAGVRLLGGVTAALPLSAGGMTVRLDAAAVKEFAERWDGKVPAEDGNQGRFDLFVGPGITLPFARDWSATVGLQARLYGRVTGAQLEMPLVVAISIGRLFHFERGPEESSEATLMKTPTGTPSRDVVDVVASGEAVPLEAVLGKWTVFDFWATWCEGCKVLGAELVRLAADDARVAVRRVNVVDLDSPIALQELRGVSVLPHLRVVDPQGVTVYEASGTPDELFRHLQDALVLLGEGRGR